MSLGEAQPRARRDVVIVPDLEEQGAIDLTTFVDGAGGPAFDGATDPNVRVSALRRYRQIGAVLIVLDVICLMLALLAAHALRFQLVPDGDYIVVIVVAGILWPGVFHALGLYAPQRLTGFEEFPRTIAAVGIGIIVLILVTFWSDVYLSRSWMAMTLVFALTLELTARMVVRSYVSRLENRDRLMLRTIVIGSKEQVDEPMQLLGQPGSGFLPLGWIDATSPVLASTDVSPTERVDRLRLVFRHYRPECIYMASTTIGRKLTFAVMQAARQEGLVVRIYTHLSGVLSSRLTAQPLSKEGVALTVKPAGLSTPQRVIKRGTDVVLATVGVIVVSPILLLATIAVGVTSGGPVLFRQQRVTEGARTFVMYKFRTMTQAGKHGADSGDLDTSVPFFKLKADPRLTRVGKALRRWSIDELPQLFNVLIGDMSLVGPRPLPAQQVSANIELLGPRHEVRSGITGWWQIQGRSDLDHEEAIRMDHFYIENWSPALDAYIMLRTIGALFTRKGAY